MANKIKRNKQLVSLTPFQLTSLQMDRIFSFAIRLSVMLIDLLFPLEIFRIYIEVKLYFYAKRFNFVLRLILVFYCNINFKSLN